MSILENKCLVAIHDRSFTLKHWYCQRALSVRLSVCLSVTLMYRGPHSQTAASRGVHATARLGCVADLTARLSWIKWENLGVIGAPALTVFAPIQR